LYKLAYENVKTPQAEVLQEDGLVIERFGDTAAAVVEAFTRRQHHRVAKGVAAGTSRHRRMCAGTRSSF